MSVLTRQDVLSLVPQQRPMRFIDDIVELDEEHILGIYTWKEEDCAGYTPENRIVPAFKIIEMAAQIGSVSWCIYHMALNISVDEIRKLVGFFTHIERGVCKSLLKAGDSVACQATFGADGYFRGNKLVSEVEIQFAGGPKDGQEVFSGIVSGIWVPKSSPVPG